MLTDRLLGPIEIHARLSECSLKVLCDVEEVGKLTVPEACWTGASFEYSVELKLSRTGSIWRVALTERTGLRLLWRACPCAR